MAKLKKEFLEDFYVKEEPYWFGEPCDTCIHRFESVKSEDCVCERCVHYHV